MAKLIDTNNNKALLPYLQEFDPISDLDQELLQQFFTPTTPTVSSQQSSKNNNNKDGEIEDETNIDNNEESPLLTKSTSNEQKGRCWACWESDETKTNPLIRVCRGCKDIDLQFIHQDCINQFINAVPDESLIREVGGPDNNKQLYIAYQCSRCKDSYNLSFKKISPFVTLWRDRFLFYAMLVMTVCLIISSVCSIWLLHQHWGTGMTVNFPMDISIQTTWFAGGIMAFCHSVNIFTWRLVYGFCSGRTVKTVHSAM